jgi:hypothetical protein
VTFRRILSFDILEKMDYFGEDLFSVRGTS